jgi:alkaline phosphatase
MLSCPGNLPPPRSRREFLQTAGIGFGWLALAGIAARQSFAAPSARPASHHPPKAKNVIFCFMDGGPSHVDTFDYKPELARRQGEKIGESAVTDCRRARPTASG